MSRAQHSSGRLRSDVGLRSAAVVMAALRIANRNDLWYLGGGAFQPHTFGYTGRPSGGHQSLANVSDLSGDYQVTREFSLGLYYAHAWSKAVIKSIYPKDPNGQFASVQTNLRF